MKIKKSIERIVMPSPQDFINQYVIPKKPVIIKHLFRDQPIAELSSPTALRKRLGDLKVTVQSEYYKSYCASGNYFSSDRHSCRLDQYLDLVTAEPNSSLLITEETAPQRITNLLQPPEICVYRSGLDGSKGLASEYFVAGKGNVAHLHFDWDHRHVLLYQVFGRKRIYLFSPEKSAFLNPILNMSQLVLESLREPARRAIVRFLEGKEAILNGGETLYIPPLMWHHLEYLDMAMSIGLRFGRTKHGRLFAERFHPNMHLQNFAWKTLESAELNGKARIWYGRMLNTYMQHQDKGIELYRRMQRVFEEAYFECCESNSEGDRYWHPISDYIEGQVLLGIDMGMLYANSNSPSKREPYSDERTA